MHSAPPRGQKEAVTALWALAASTGAAKAAIVQAGGASAVVCAMAVHPGSAELQEVGLGALASLALRGHAPRLARDGARRVAEAARAGHPAHERIQTLSEELLAALAEAEGEEPRRPRRKSAPL